MSGVDTERVINNIISEVVQKCAARGHEVSGNLVAFMVSITNSFASFLQYS